MLDHHAEQQVVRLGVDEAGVGRDPVGWQHRKNLGRCPDPLEFGLLARVQEIVIVGETAAVAEEFSDGRPVGVECEGPGKVVGHQVVNGQLAGLDHQHDLGCDHGLGDAGDRELVIDLDVSNTVRLARRPTPGALGGHHCRRHPSSARHVVHGKAAWNMAADSAVTGSSLMAANASMEKAAAALGPGLAGRVGDGVAGVLAVSRGAVGTGDAPVAGPQPTAMSPRQRPSTWRITARAKDSSRPRGRWSHPCSAGRRNRLAASLDTRRPACST
jgi:hypothetical protein